jgi:anti-anti-sigma factor
MPSMEKIVMLNKPVVTSKSSTEFHISGIIDFDNVAELTQQTCEIIDKATQEIKFNFAEISQSNSAGLALLTALLRHANEKQKHILFLHLPAKLLAAAKISDLDAILPCTQTI